MVEFWVLQVALNILKQSRGARAASCRPEADGSRTLPHKSLNPMGQLSQQAP